MLITLLITPLITLLTQFVFSMLVTTFYDVSFTRITAYIRTNFY